ncbi:MAG: DNA repair protein RadA [Candidatus Eisenbacteria bacterium]
MVFLCSDCGDTSVRWFGQCLSCGAWNTLKEFHPPADSESPGRSASGSLLGPSRPDGPRGTGAARAVAHRGPAPANGRTASRLDEVPLERVPRQVTGIGEFDRILGGGLVPGSVVLIGGDPGIGKSTLLLQTAGSLVRRGARVLYVSGEESASQIRLRAERVTGVPPELLVLPATNLEEVGPAILEAQPDVLVVDSIQTAYLPSVASAPGSVSQVRESALALIELAKGRDMTVILVGHVTKEGTLAGPRTLEHMVDTVLYMEGERYQHYRILRSAKNRFGSVDEIGVFEMVDRGLQEVPNPSQVFLSEHTAGAVGSVVSASVEGTRAILMEIQSLVNPTRYGIPQRLTTGFDGKRLEIILAVLAKRAGIDFSQHDVFVNVAGGLRVVEPGVDLGVCLAVASSRKDLPPQPDTIALGEIGLGGELRRIAHPERRITEVARLGYQRVLLPEANARDLGASREGVRIVGAGTVVEALHEGLRQGREQ